MTLTFGLQPLLAFVEAVPPLEPPLVHFAPFQDLGIASPIVATPSGAAFLPVWTENQHH